MIQFKEFIKDKEKEKMLQEHQLYMKGCAEDNRRKEEQENRWNKYYRDFDQNLTKKMKEYEQK